MCDRSASGRGRRLDFLDQAPAPLCRDGRQDGGDVVDLRPLRKSRHVVRDHRGFVAVDARELEGLVPRPCGDEPIVAKLPSRIIDTKGPVDGAPLVFGGSAPRSDA